MPTPLPNPQSLLAALNTLERTLVFSPTDGAVRRVSKYPNTWRSLDDAALFALSQQKA